ncbi:MAG: hypothetical protein ACTSRI_05105 [Promethearchaeota archaeon]
MMENQERIKNILVLTEKIAQNYLKNNKDCNIKFLKEKMNDFITNLFWNDNLLFQLRNKITELNLSDSEFKSLWKNIENIIDSSYSKYVERKPHIFEGKIREYEKRLIECFVEAGRIKGQNPVFSSIIGYLLVHKEVTQAQLKELTGFSKGSISANLNILLNSPAVKKKIIKGTRKYLYSFGGDLSEIASSISMYKTEINEIAIKFIQAKAHELNKNIDKKGYKILSERMGEISNFLQIHKKLINIITKSDFIKDIEMRRI